MPLSNCSLFNSQVFMGNVAFSPLLCLSRVAILIKDEIGSDVESWNGQLILIQLDFNRRIIRRKSKLIKNKFKIV